MNISNRKSLIYILFIVLYLVGISFYANQDVMDIDSTQYAEITREMIVNKDYLFLRDNGRKYLDKPIFTFWILASSFKILGIHNFGYRFPSFLALLLSLWGIYKISLLLTNDKKKSLFATLLYCFTPSLYSMITSPIIDIYLTTILIYIHYFYFLGRERNENYFYLMYFMVGLGFLTKGPISLVIPSISIGLMIFLKREFALLKKIKLISGFFIIIVMVSFWSYILYKDFRIFGPYFFIYLQSFGRFFSKVYDTGWNPFYFYYTFIFSILHFALPFIIILFLKLKTIWNELKTNWSINQLNTMINRVDYKELILILWSLVTLFLLSFSKFRLPQYIFWLIPPTAILGSQWISNYIESYQNKKIKISFLIVPFFVFVLWVYFYIYSGLPFHFIFYLFLMFIIFIFFIFKLYKDDYLFIIIPFSIFLLFYVYITTTVYPFLIKFQPASQIQRLLKNENDFQKEDKQNILYTYGVPLSHRSYAFYLGRIVRPYLLKKEEFMNSLKLSNSKIMIVDEQFLPFLEKDLHDEFQEVNVEILGKFPSYKVSKPKLKFFNPRLRENYIKYIYVVKIKI